MGEHHRVFSVSDIPHRHQVVRQMRIIVDVGNCLNMLLTSLIGHDHTQIPHLIDSFLSSEAIDHAWSLQRTNIAEQRRIADDGGAAARVEEQGRLLVRGCIQAVLLVLRGVHTNDCRDCSPCLPSIADAMPIVAGTRDIYEQKEHHPRNCLLVRVSEIADALGCRVAHAHELRADDA